MHVGCYPAPRKMGSSMEYIFVNPRTKCTEYFQVQNVLGTSTFCPWIEVNVPHLRTHDPGLTAMFLIQVHNTSTKFKKCTGFRTRTHFFLVRRLSIEEFDSKPNGSWQQCVMVGSNVSWDWAAGRRRVNHRMRYLMITDTTKRSVGQPRR